MIHGQNLLTEVDGVRRRLGFFTNVFIEAFASADAESRAIDSVREDAGLSDILLNPDDDPLSLSVDEVQEIESFGDRKPGKDAFMFYPGT